LVDSRCNNVDTLNDWTGQDADIVALEATARTFTAVCTHPARVCACTYVCVCACAPACLLVCLQVCVCVPVHRRLSIVSEHVCDIFLSLFVCLVCMSAIVCVMYVLCMHQCWQMRFTIASKLIELRYTLIYLSVCFCFFFFFLF